MIRGLFTVATAAVLCGLLAPQAALLFLQMWALALPHWPPLRPMLSVMVSPELLEGLAQFGRLILTPLAATAGALGAWRLLRAQARGAGLRVLSCRALVGGSMVGAAMPATGLLVMDLIGSRSEDVRLALRDICRPLTIVGAVTGLLFGLLLAVALRLSASSYARPHRP